MWLPQDKFDTATKLPTPEAMGRPTFCKSWVSSADMPQRFKIYI